jgi:polysaccharide deacetylase family protein (PEP-CTERM system associated)
MPAKITARSPLAMDQLAENAPQDLGAVGSGTEIVNAMSVDVEEFFQVTAFAPTIKQQDWENYESRVENCVDRLLDLFAAHNASCTFFTLGWVAERHKKMIQRIVDGGHEIASHGYSHQRVTDQTTEEFRADIRLSKKILEDLSGSQVTGYRAASFSFSEANTWAHGVLEEEGHSYSSSVYPVAHDHYGMPSAPRFPYKPLPGKDFTEFPLTTVSKLGRNIPCAGGGYFRLFPYGISRWAMQHVNENYGEPTVFYFHPWEIDPDQPRPEGASLKTRFRHYVNLSRMEHKLSRLLSDFRWDRIDNVLHKKIKAET